MSKFFITRIILFHAATIFSQQVDTTGIYAEKKYSLSAASYQPDSLNLISASIGLSYSKNTGVMHDRIVFTISGMTNFNAGKAESTKYTQGTDFASTKISCIPRRSIGFSINYTFGKNG